MRREIRLGRRIIYIDDQPAEKRAQRPGQGKCNNGNSGSIPLEHSGRAEHSITHKAAQHRTLGHTTMVAGTTSYSTQKPSHRVASALLFLMHARSLSTSCVSFLPPSVPPSGPETNNTITPPPRHGQSSS